MARAYVYAKGEGNPGAANIANFETRDLSGDNQELNSAIKAAGRGASAGGALAGAATGAAAGSTVPVIGTAIGAGIGIAASTLFGDPERILVTEVLRKMVLSKWGKKRAKKTDRGIVLTGGAYPAQEVLQVVKDLNTGLARTSGGTYSQGEARQYNSNLVVRTEPPNLQPRQEEGNTARGDAWIVAFETPEPEPEVADELTPASTFEALADSPYITVGAGIASIAALAWTVSQG